MRSFCSLLVQAVWGQQERKPPIVSPDVQPDRRITFRLQSPGAKEVLLSREGAKSVPMQKGENGLWTVTTEPLEPDLYGYSFVVDGTAILDPENVEIKPNLLHIQSVVRVPGSPPLPWEMTAVPHGEIHHHFYKSAIVGDNRDYYVYTPPGYDPKGST